LKNYTDIFKELTKLPPTKKVEHCIPLKEGIELVNIDPTGMSIFKKLKLKSKFKTC